MGTSVTVYCDWVTVNVLSNGSIYEVGEREGGRERKGREGER